MFDATFWLFSFDLYNIFVHFALCIFFICWCDEFGVDSGSDEHDSDLEASISYALTHLRSAYNCIPQFTPLFHLN